MVYWCSLVRVSLGLLMDFRGDGSGTGRVPLPAYNKRKGWRTLKEPQPYIPATTTTCIVSRQRDSR
eukprot:scaffold24427_cov20-Prasinocladus_malaysianus.AAC.1